MGKNANNQGSIYKRIDKKTGKIIRWEGQITIGRDEITGKLKRISLTGKTQKEVKDKMDKMIMEIRAGTFIDRSKILTIAEHFTIWLELYKKPPNVKLSTYVSYEMLCRRHLIPKLGHIKLNELRPETLQKFYNEKAQSGRVDGKGGLSPKTMRNLHNMIHEGLQQATLNGLIYKNVSEATKLPKRNSRKKEIQVISADEQIKFLKAIEFERLKCAYYLLLGSGVRLGELLGLKWDKVDFKEGIIKIRLTVNRLKNINPTEENSPKTKIVFDEPKSQSSIRDIPIPPSIVQELIKHKERQDEERKLFGSSYNVDNFVFCSTVGTPLEPRSLIRDIHSICKKNKLRRYNIHLTRHTYTTRLAEKNIHPRIIQELLGHANPDLNVNTYSHPSLDNKKDTVYSIDDSFNTQNPNEKKR